MMEHSSVGSTAQWWSTRLAHTTKPRVWFQAGVGGIMNIIAYIFDMYRNYWFTCVEQLCICEMTVFLFRIIPSCLIKGFFFFLLL